MTQFRNQPEDRQIEKKNDKKINLNNGRRLSFSVCLAQSPVRKTVHIILTHTL